jgi:hypothetical protein
LNSKPDNLGSSDWVGRIKAELVRDKKKTLVLSGLLIVAAVVLGRLVIPSSGPQTVSGAVAVASSGDARGPRPEHVQPTDQGEPRERLELGPRQITRDIFKPEIEMFPPAERVRTVQHVATSGPSPQDDELLARRVAHQASSLSLQSTILGSSPTAIVNNRVLTVGDWISNFEVIEITSRTCVVRKDGVKVTLEMSN